MKRVTICGVPHTVEFSDDKFETSLNYGVLDYTTSEIKINSKLRPEELIKETICHEILHAMLVFIGREDLSTDETFVTSLATAMSQTFDIRWDGEDA